MHQDNFIPFEYTPKTEKEMLADSKEFLDLMKKRRTVRQISSKPLPDGLLENIILAAGTAPSGANKQPWFFAVVKDPALKKQIREQSEEYEIVNYREKYSEEWKRDIQFTGTDHVKEFIEKAPALIIVFKQRFGLENGSRTRHYYISESVGIAMGMLFTAIHNAGLVTVPYTPMPRAFLGDLLERGEHESAVLVLPVGYPEEDAVVPAKTTKSLEEIMKIY
jgi:iodotyrosine deiodinase